MQEYTSKKRAKKQKLHTSIKRSKTLVVRNPSCKTPDCKNPWL